MAPEKTHWSGSDYEHDSGLSGSTKCRALLGLAERMLRPQHELEGLLTIPSNN